MILTYKYRLKGKRLERKLRKYVLIINNIWNYCVEIQKATQRRWREGANVHWLKQWDFQRLCGGTSRELGIHSQSIQNVCYQFTRNRDIQRKCPRFRHSSGPKRSLGWVPFQKQGRKITSESITYMNQTFRFFGTKRRPLPANAKGGDFVEDARGCWWVCFHVEIKEDKTAGPGAIGIDLGLEHLATLSTGQQIECPKPYRKWETKLSTAQRAHNKRRVSAIGTKIGRIRKDYLHKISNSIVRENKMIVVGNVNVSSLTKTRLAKSVLDAGWSTFRNMLRYKASRHGALFLEVDERFTTQTCSSCGALPPERPKGIAGLGIRSWKCSSCGAIHDRDVNAAKNILMIGLSAQPRVDENRNTG